MPQLKFSKKGLLALPPPATKPAENYYDTATPKLALRITKGDARAFYVIRRVSGQVAWVRLGSFPEMTVEQARQEASKVLGEFASGRDPAAAKRTLRGEPTFGEALVVFLANKRKRDGTPIGDKTKRDYQDVVRLHWPALASRKLSAISRADVKTAHARITKISAAQADKAVALVSAVFMFMRDTDRFAGLNPAERVKKNPPITRDRFLQPSELPAFFEALGDLPNPSMRDLFLLALFTGARRANLCAMKWADVDLTGRVWRVAKTKNGLPQNITLSPEAVAVLEGRKEGSDGRGFVFPGAGKTGHLVEPKAAWRSVLRRASFYKALTGLTMDPHDRNELRALASTRFADAEARIGGIAAEAKANLSEFDMNDVRIHDLRRTLGSWQAREGSSLTVIGKSLNHKTYQATQIYARLDLDPVRASVNAATSAIVAAAGVHAAAAKPSRAGAGDDQRST